LAADAIPGAFTCGLIVDASDEKVERPGGGQLRPGTGARAGIPCG